MDDSMKSASGGMRHRTSEPLPKAYRVSRRARRASQRGPSVRNVPVA